MRCSHCCRAIGTCCRCNAAPGSGSRVAWSRAPRPSSSHRGAAPESGSRPEPSMRRSRCRREAAAARTRRTLRPSICAGARAWAWAASCEGSGGRSGARRADSRERSAVELAAARCPGGRMRRGSTTTCPVMPACGAAASSCRPHSCPENSSLGPGALQASCAPCHRASGSGAVSHCRAPSRCATRCGAASAQTWQPRPPLSEGAWQNRRCCRSRSDSATSCCPPPRRHATSA
mmetsp:Transcript_50644/g.123479  ORF Transcript_50644/g.123479 Transcript_50644/m.123479 type:complete len:233 (+) Transcript_50644:177-875(+)